MKLVQHNKTPLAQNTARALSMSNVVRRVDSQLLLSLVVITLLVIISSVTGMP